MTVRRGPTLSTLVVSGERSLNRTAFFKWCIYLFDKIFMYENEVPREAFILYQSIHGNNTYAEQSEAKRGTNRRN